ncbi:MAG: type II secretion system F family protein, partial [Gammaproteobacteria bacterium]
MPQMQYKAMDENGRTSVGVVEAVNVADLEMRLSRMGLDLINFKERGVKRSRAGRIPHRDMIGFTFHLEQLITAGVPLVDGLVDLRDSTENPRMREVMAGMIESIEGGKTLSGAMEEYPQMFDDVFVNLIKAGEFSGQLGEVLRSITENLKWQDEQAEQVKKLLTDPVIVGAVVTGVVFFLMTYLVPQLVGFMENMGQTLPMHTQVLIMVSAAFVTYWYLFLITPVLGFMGLLTLIRLSPSVAYAVDDLKLRVWVIGPLMKKIILAR